MSVRFLIGCVRDRLRDLPDGSVHCIVTSPPYFGLRDYGTAGQIGLEPTPDAYVTTMVEVFREARRVLRDDGTLWLNLGDSYGQQNGKGFNTHANIGGTNRVREMQKQYGDIRVKTGLAPKNLIGIPWRVAFALQADGWYLRSDIIWHKPNPMPESVTDRPTSAHEHIFLLTKRERYWYDAEAVKEPASGEFRPSFRGGAYVNNATFDNAKGGKSTDVGNIKLQDASRNLRNVWTVATQPYSEAHFATFPPALIEPCIKAGCPEKCCPHCGAGWERETEKGEPDRPLKRGGQSWSAETGQQHSHGGMPIRTATTLGFDPSCSCPDHTPVPGTVLDPFGGAGTTALVADRLGRNAILIELNPAYADMARRRIEGDAGMFAQLTEIPAAG